MNIGIAGAGLVGRLLAWRLLKQGFAVSLFDKDKPQGTKAAGYTAAAMLSPFAELAIAEPVVFELGQESLRLYPNWIKELEEDSGQEVFYQKKGSLVLSHSADLPTFKHFKSIIKNRLPQAEASKLQDLTSSELARIEPELAGRFHHSSFIPDEAHVDNQQLFDALHKVIIKLGGKWFTETEVLAVTRQRMTTTTANLSFDLVIDCRGRGGQLVLRGVRGEVITLTAPDVHLSRPVRLIHPLYQLYLVPRQAHRFIVGATELESEDLRPATVRSTLELLTAAYSVHPGFAEATIEKIAVNLRPALPDNKPFVGWQEGVLHINGLYRHGYLLAPALIQQALAQLKEAI